MVIVVSDRRVIDKQLQEQVKDIEKVKGIVEVINKDSQQLAEALQTGSNIVVTTLQKFPFILEKVHDMELRNYAVIIDEAHSSQTGTMARKMKQALTTNSLEEAEVLVCCYDVDEELLREIEYNRNLENIRFFSLQLHLKVKPLKCSVQ
jgi:type I restriction enzyme R subunit